MRTRTAFKIHDNGVVRCTCGSIEDFAKDICEFIIPILDCRIDAEFGGRNRTIYTNDNVETIRMKFMSVLAV